VKKTLLSVENVSSGYGGELILRNVDFRVCQGELMGIIGPNGSGKSTLLRTVSRILRPRQGRIHLDGKDIGGMSHREFARKVSVVSQSPESAEMRVREYILLGRLPYFGKYQFFETDHDEALVERYMELTHVSRFKNSMMSEISGGERQLASIARALVQEPELLLLDEPTSHLDITHQVQILELIRRLNRELGLTVLMVLHDLNLASAYSTRLLLMNRGSVFKVGSPEEVITYRIVEDVYETVAGNGRGYEKGKKRMIEIFEKGGPVMYPLLACSLMALTVIIERLIFWIGEDIRRDQKLVDRVLSLCQTGRWDEVRGTIGGSRDFVIRILVAGILHRDFSMAKAMESAAADEVKRMNRYMVVLDTMITVAPLLGIFGTVIGIINSFDLLGATGIEDPRAVTAGIAQALITTAAGLGIAILSVFPYNYFNSRISLAVTAIEKYATSLEIVYEKLAQDPCERGEGDVP